MTRIVINRSALAGH